MFPAYTGPAKFDPSSEEDRDWLRNNSFRAGPSTNEDALQIEKESKSLQSLHTQTKKTGKKINDCKKKAKLKKEHNTTKFLKQNSTILQISEDCNLYCIDKTRRKEYLYLPTLIRPLKPKYKLCKKYLIGPKYVKNKKDKNYRYFMFTTKALNAEEEEKAENELQVLRTSEGFNRALYQNSSVEEWIKFVEFQDEFIKSQSIAYKTESDRENAIKRRKLDILQRAMNYNKEDDELLGYWVKIGMDILSPHEMSTALQEMIQVSPGRLSLWLSLISVGQQSLALCTYPFVTEFYKNAVNCLKSYKTDNIVARDSDILELLFQYCKFLQDSGHWEVLWTILNNNIKLNFGLDINIDLGITDARVKKLEDDIITVKEQPIWVTWRTVESLREGLHFLPVAEPGCYPQRCVFLNDLLDFIVHFHRDLHLKLIIKFLILLKVPPLPFNTAVAKALYRTESAWTLDSPELILSTAFNAASSEVKIDYLKFVAPLCTGPQYLRNVEGREEFLELIQETFRECMKVLEGKKKVFLALWWLRFNRWLFILDKHSLASLQFTVKKMKNFFRCFMRSPENRENLMYYYEYSLFEYNQGNIEGSIKTLKTVISARGSVHDLTDEMQKAALCQINRLLSELYLEMNQKEEAVTVLINLALGSTNCEREDINLALSKYENIMSGLLQDIQQTSDSVEEILVPRFSVQWIHCYLWLLALTDSADNEKNLYEKLDSELKLSENSFSNYAREYFCEAVATIFWTLEKSHPLSKSHLEIIKNGLTQFPYNLKLTSLLASRKLNEHGLWWTLKQSFTNPATIIGCVVLICVALARKDTDEDTYRNRLKALFRQLIPIEGKLSSVIHRLRLIFLSEYDQSQLDSAHINALESCPWNKSVYMSAASVLPNKLMELTDILTEKELRIHVTPDEIIEMRD